MKEFDLIKNKDNVYIEPIKYSGDKISERMMRIGEKLRRF